MPIFCKHPLLNGQIKNGCSRVSSLAALHIMKSVVLSIIKCLLFNIFLVLSLLERRSQQKNFIFGMHLAFHNQLYAAWGWISPWSLISSNLKLVFFAHHMVPRTFKLEDVGCFACSLSHFLPPWLNTMQLTNYVDIFIIVASLRDWSRIVILLICWATTVGVLVWSYKILGGNYNMNSKCKFYLVF